MPLEFVKGDLGFIVATFMSRIAIASTRPQSPFSSFSLSCRLREILEADRRFQNVTEMAHRLKTRRKRLYEAVNVLSEIGFLEKKGYDSFYTYNGNRCLPLMVSWSSVLKCMSWCPG